MMCDTPMDCYILYTSMEFYLILFTIDVSVWYYILLAIDVLVLYLILFTILIYQHYVISYL